MDVKQLRKILEDFPDNAEVYVSPANWTLSQLARNYQKMIDLDDGTTVRGIVLKG